MISIDFHSFGSSWFDGKEEIQSFLWRILPPNAKILDVGAGGGTYRQLLGPNYNWSAIEIWPPAAEFLKTLYDTVYQIDIRNFVYTQNYDFIIFGDVIEHLEVVDAQQVLKEAKNHTSGILIGVPYNLVQDVIYNNIAEKHLQPDLTDEIFHQRYPNFKRIVHTKRYGYYYWNKETKNYDNWFMCNS